ncbi:B-cell CLL/lymphoma 9-like protein isoform X2 [Synchiropus splendidus]|uniref:B-cell CLL/lymphoma 9-like protein isoform X2 n=1 Tax=Synchiropus splendidus TaxID=270530 RepID=UPI00237EAF07|nr:B-cell CLL/lymphoma 9-like protein isoform X2 [Synchiropus splendidus]
MLTDSNVANHAAAVSGDSRSQTSSQQQQGDAHPGLKNISAGTNGAKANQIFTGNSGLKAVGQTLSGVGGMLKAKTKRERSVSTDSEPRNAAPACVEPDAKGGVMRSKRRCVLEKKQPYSGDEWCSGPDTEDDEDKLPRAAAQRGRGHSGPLLRNPDCLSKGSGLPESAVPALVCGLGPKAEPPTSPQMVYVFTTSLANSAAEAVLKGQTDSILQYHQQNVPGAKLEQELHPGKLSEKVNSSISPPSATSKPDVGSQRLPTAGVAGRLPDPESSITLRSATPAGPGPADGTPLPAGSQPESPSVLPSRLQNEACQRAGIASGLSREQLEHRQRSLQTLRDIERLFLRSEAGGGPGDVGDPHNSLKHIGSTEDGDSSAGNVVLPGLARMKSHEEPLQSIISQTQSLSGPAPGSPQMDPQNHLPQQPPHQLSSPGSDLGHLLGPEGLTPEQIAWRKLQEEYYQEKRRMQEVQPPPHQLRMISEMGIPGGPMGMRGPPPPYHSKPGEWPPGHVMSGGQMDVQQEGPRGPKFLGPMQRRPTGRGGFPGSPGGVLSMEGLGPQRPNRSGMVWIDDLPNTGGGGPYPGYYPGRSLQQVQGDPEHLLTREEILCIMDKRQRLSKQQQMGLSSRSLDSQDFANMGMGRVDHMDFHGSRDIMFPGGGGPQMRDLVDPRGGNLNSQMSLLQQQQQQQQQSMMLFQKLRGGPQGEGALSELFNQDGLRLQTSHSERGNKGMIEDFPFQGPFSGGPMEAPFQQSGPDMFDPANQLGSATQLSHMPPAGGHRDVGPKHPSDLNINVHPLVSPIGPFPRPFKSPSINQAPSPRLPSPSGTGIKSPPHMVTAAHHPSRAGTPSSAAMKSPQVMGSSNLGMPSPSVSPGRLKSPAVAVSSPGWVSPKTALPSPSGPRVLGNSTETGQPLPPRSSSSSTPSSQPSSLNPSAPSDGAPSQNPLSLIMSQMSKYAMPSATPLYHDAIKTIATSDDEMLPDRPLLSNVQIGGNAGNLHIPQSSLGPNGDPPSPLGMVSQGQQQQLSLEASEPALPTPNHMGMPSMNPGVPDAMGPCNVSPMSQNQLGGFPRMQPPPHGPMHSPVGMSQNFPQPDEALLPPQPLHMLGKGHPQQRHPSEPFPPLPMRDGPDLSEVIRPTHSGIPEFDLSRIIPSDKPSSTLQYFPKSDPPSSNPHLANLQNMMAEQQLPPHPSHVGVRPSMAVLQGGPRGMGSACAPGHMMVRTGMMSPQQQQAMMANNLRHLPPNAYAGMMPPQQQHNLMARQNMMMLQAKQRGMPTPVDPFGPQGPLMSPQGPMMTPPHPQSGLMGPQSLRQRGMSVDSPVGFGPGGMTNMPF